MARQSLHLNQLVLAGLVALGLALTTACDTGSRDDSNKDPIGSGAGVSTGGGGGTGTGSGSGQSGGFDLVVTDMNVLAGATGAFIEGTRVVVDCTVENIGSQDITNDSSILILASDDNIIDPNTDVFTDIIDVAAPLSPGFPTTVPNQPFPSLFSPTIEPGDFFFGALGDFFDDVAGEDDETNNEFVTPNPTTFTEITSGRSELVADFFQISGTNHPNSPDVVSLSQGGIIDIDFFYANCGDTDTPGAYDVQVIFIGPLSAQQPDFATTTIALGPTTASDQYEVLSTSVTVPVVASTGATLQPGDYVVLIAMDVDNQGFSGPGTIVEEDEDENNWSNVWPLTLDP